MDERGSTSISGGEAHRPRTRLARWVWTAAGLVLLAIGGLGVVVPGLPSTVFFIGAAACFSRSHAGLERWVLGLPRIGPLVRDYRAGLGMPRRAKALAVGTIMVAVGFSVSVIPSWPGKFAALGLALLGIGYILARVPTREQVLSERSATDR